MDGEGIYYNKVGNTYTFTYTFTCKVDPYKFTKNSSLKTRFIRRKRGRKGKAHVY